MVWENSPLSVLASQNFEGEIRYLKIGNMIMWNDNVEKVEILQFLRKSDDMRCDGTFLQNKKKQDWFDGSLLNFEARQSPTHQY